VAHVGVLSAFQKSGQHISYLAGSSIGAVVAALYSFGVPLVEIEDIVASLNWKTITDFGFGKDGGLFSNQLLGKAVTNVIGNTSIEDAPIPLAITATDISSGEKVVLRSGNLKKALMATTCVPGLYAPIEIDQRFLVDGGLLENVPISPLFDMGARYVYAVDLGHGAEYRRPTTFVDVLLNAFEVAIDHNTIAQLKRADSVIGLNLSSFSRIICEDPIPLVNVGREKALEVLEHDRDITKIIVRYFLKIKRNIQELFPWVFR
jgi:NTE family protein